MSNDSILSLTFSNQIINTINCGIVVIDREYTVYYWNHWMEIYSHKNSSDIIGKNLLEVYSNLNNHQFIRSCKSTFSFGNFIFISQKLHKYLIPLKAFQYSNLNIDYMQQSCALFPLRDENNIINYICIAIYDVTEIVMYQMKLLDLARTDMLTGIFNRRYLEERLNEEWERHKRHNRPLSLVIFDIDNFKKINDTFGHYIGDIVIKSVAETAKNILRDIDIFARYGGEEFCCILPDTNKTAALYVAERIRNVIENNNLKLNKHNIKLTISAGVAQMNSSMNGSEDLIRLADNALYMAKRAGKNRVILEI